MSEGCATCGARTVSKPVSAYEEVSAVFCEQCQHVIEMVEDLIDAPGPLAQPALQLHALGRLRRIEQVAHELIRRRIFAALVTKASWDDIGEALRLSPDEAKQRYSRQGTPENNWGWG